MSSHSLSSTAALSRSHPLRCSAAPISRAHATARPPLTCPIRRPSHRSGVEPPLTWEELLGRR